MPKLIAIDDGHGMETPGKRTPVFPVGTPYAGKFMHENEFNRVVAVYLIDNLERCGFRTLMVAPGDADVPLKTRTDTANSSNADFYISIHANALNGQWGDQQGIAVYHYPGSEKSRAAAIIIHRQLINGTKQKDRGILTANFHVLRETKMPAVLVECAFMDNLREAQLLMSDAFRRECADEICKGICEYFAVAYIPAVKEPAVCEMVDLLNKTNPQIIGDVSKWLKKTIEDKDTYWLIKKMFEYVKVKG